MLAVTSSLPHHSQDEYVRLRNEEEPGATEIDGRMVAIVERMFERCYADQGERPCSGAENNKQNNKMGKITRQKTQKSIFLEPAAAPPYTCNPVATAWTQAMGVALESRRLDKVKEVLERSSVAEVC